MPFGARFAQRQEAMRRKVKITRRQFIRVAAAGVAAAPMLGCGAGRSPWRFFTQQEGEVLGALCDRIIPEDQFPGAARAGVVNYIDLQLMGPYKRFRSAYRRGLKGADQTSQAIFRKSFVTLRGAQQDEVLQALEKGSAPGAVGKETASREFFDLLLSHAMQGFYGDPRHGGNRERVSWQMVGLPYPPIRGRLHYDLTKPGTTSSG